MKSPITLDTPTTELPEEGGSQVVKVQIRLRQMILAGELSGGMRVPELSMVEKLGVSRTPIRSALIRLEQEGLLQALPNGGYAVRTFSERDVTDAIELRGTIEGMAARLAAERGVAPVVLAQAHDCLNQIDGLLHDMVLSDEAFSRYVALNEAFHSLLGELSGSAFMRRELARVISQPFASPSGLVIVQAESQQARDMLIVAQSQHRQVLDAIENREGARAEAIMREHSRLAQRNLRDAVRNLLETQMPGVRLIRRRNSDE